MAVAALVDAPLVHSEAQHVSASDWERDRYVESIRQTHDDAQASLEAYLNRVMSVLEEVLAKNARQLGIIDQLRQEVIDAAQKNLDGIYILALLAKVNGGTLTIPRWVLQDSPRNLGELVREDGLDGSIIFTLRERV